MAKLTLILTLNDTHDA